MPNLMLHMSGGGKKITHFDNQLERIPFLYISSSFIRSLTKRDLSCVVHIDGGKQMWHADVIHS